MYTYNFSNSRSIFRRSQIVIFTLLVLAMGWVSCNGSGGRSKGIVVNTAPMYEQLGIVDEIADCFDKGDMVCATVLLYDDRGQLVATLRDSADDLLPITIENENIPNGSYTLLVLNHRNQSEGNAWMLVDEDRLATARIETEFGLRASWALGIAVESIKVTDGSICTEVTPQPVGSVVELRVDNLTGEQNIVYMSLNTETPAVQGYRLNPSLDEEDRLCVGADKYTDILHLQKQLNEVVVAQSIKYFTLNCGDNVSVNLFCRQKGLTELRQMAKGKMNLHPGSTAIFYYDFNPKMLFRQYVGSSAAFDAWLDRRNSNPYELNALVKWGAPHDDMKAHMASRGVYWDGNLCLEQWKGRGWHKWYYLANDFHEGFIFENRYGRQLKVSRFLYEGAGVSLQQVEEALMAQGYVLHGQTGKQIVFNLFLSADGRTEVFTWPEEPQGWNVWFQPYDPDDFAVDNETSHRPDIG